MNDQDDKAKRAAFVEKLEAIADSFQKDVEVAKNDFLENVKSIKREGMEKAEEASKAAEAPEEKLEEELQDV